jgi:hypothetical protein
MAVIHAEYFSSTGLMLQEGFYVSRDTARRHGKKLLGCNKIIINISDINGDKQYVYEYNTVINKFRRVKL